MPRHLLVRRSSAFSAKRGEAMGTYLTADGNTTIYAQDESLAQAFVRYTKEELQDVARSFFKIGFRLAEANKYRYYEELGYDNIIDLAEDVFGFKKSTAYGLMQVYHHCKSRDRNDSALTMDKAYQDYNFSQLQEISRLKWGGGEHLIKPTDSVAKIKQFVSAWNKDGESSNASGCKTINDYLRKTGRLTDAEPAALPSPNLLEPGDKIFQTSGKIEETEPEEPSQEEPPAVVECELIEAQDKPSVDYVDGEDYSQYDDELPKRPESEIIKVGLKGVDIYVEDAKFWIYDRYRNEPLKGDFSEFIKSVYNYSNKQNFTHGFYSKEDNMNRTYEENGVQFISFDPHQTIRLTWEEVARHISELIYTDEYLTGEEQEQYLNWKAENEGLEVKVEDGRAAADVLPVSDKEYDNLIKDLDSLMPKDKAKTKLLNLKNVKARKAWLDDFRSWGIWLEIKEVDKTFYRYNFANGAALIVEVGFEYWNSWSTQKGAHERVSYSIIDEEHPKFNSQGESYTNVITWLTTHAKEI